MSKINVQWLRIIGYKNLFKKIWNALWNYASDTFGLDTQPLHILDNS